MFKMDRTHIAAMLLTVGWLGLCGPAVAAVRIGGQVQVAGGCRKFHRHPMGRERRRTQATGSNKNRG